MIVAGRKIVDLPTAVFDETNSWILIHHAP